VTALESIPSHWSTEVSPERPPRREEVKLYFDYKSPFAFLAAEPAFALSERFAVELRWIPFLLRIKGKGERSQYSEWKARYSYMDARRWANRRGGFPIKGPLKVYDSSPALVGGLFARRRGFFRPYSIEVYSRFFERQLEIDRAEEIARLITALGHPGEDYLRYLGEEGRGDLDRCIEEAHGDRIFGVPIFLFRGEPFWGHDRIPLLEERLTACGLRLPGAEAPGRDALPDTTAPRPDCRVLPREGSPRMITVFRSRLRPEHAGEFGELASRMLELARSMPGFLSYEVFTSEDGGRCSIIEFDSAEHLRAWREHPEHRRAQQIGRERFYEEYDLQVGEVARESRFKR
jgi:2-hydroxychromene-2-carboxylate isomerase/heme-degrading monooxygenase HmoA